MGKTMAKDQRQRAASTLSRFVVCASHDGHFMYYPPWTATCPTLIQNDAWACSSAIDYFDGMHYTGSMWVYSTEGWQFESEFWNEYCDSSVPCYTMLTNVVSGTYENISSFYFQGDYIDAWA